MGKKTTATGDPGGNQWQSAQICTDLTDLTGPSDFRFLRWLGFMVVVGKHFDFLLILV